jgi:ornithine cyclodeaminase/alanine dehydrogenase-like protein (mu-crystallin family)
MLFINNDDVQKVFNTKMCMEILEEAYKEEGRGTAVNRTKSNIHVPITGPDYWYRYCSMDGALREAGVAATRLKSDLVNWPKVEGKSRAVFYCMEPGIYCGIIFLFSARNGEPLAIMNDGVLQHLRLGATAGIAARYMAKINASVVGVLGSGGAAEAYVRGYAAVRDLSLIKVYSPHKEHRDEFAKKLTRELNVEVVPTQSPREVVTHSDIVASCTDSNEPTILGEWLENGMHVATVNQREADEHVYRRIQRYVKYQSDITTNIFAATDGMRPPSLGGSGPEQVRLVGLTPEKGRFHLTDLLVKNVSGRESEEEINFFKQEGTGVQFAALGYKVYLLCKEKGLGRSIPLDWFTETIRN